MKETILFILFLFLFDLIRCEDVIVETKNGKVKGHSVNALNKTIYEFIGMRYAKPPIGELRFKKPVPVDSWTGVYDATERGYICWQLNNTKYRIEDMSEDCLRVNVWTPNLSNQTLLPVMLWIHGGIFASGSSYRYSYNGSALATFDIVLVGFDFRLNSLGFLFSGTDRAPGNLGLYDQVEAIKWVQSNIASFGGDPNQVTIFGVSSGGMSVGIHMVSPLSKNLFKRAIMSSGAPYSFNGDTSDRSLVLQKSKELSQEMNCTVDESSDKWVDCLRNVTPYDLIYAKRTITDLIIGDQVFPMTAVSALKNGQFNSEYELLSGVTKDEFTMNGFALPETLTVDDLAKIIPSLTSLSSQQVDQIIQQYVNDRNNSWELRRAYGKIDSDFGIICPTFLMASDFASHSTNNKVYFYNLTYRANDPYNQQCNTDEVGVCHAEDLVFNFGLPILYPEKNYTQKDYDFSLLYMTLWTNFAKHGNPMTTSPNSNLNYLGTSLQFIDWPLINQHPNNHQVMVLDPDNFGQILTNPYKETCENIWRNHYT